MALQRFLDAVAAASEQYAGQYGLSPDELRRALITAAYLEGGLGEEAGVGDGGASVGRFQFHTAGGHGSTLINQGYTREQIADDVFQANHWAPILAGALASAKQQYGDSPEAVRQAIYAVERPAAIYPADRFNAGWQTAGGTGSSSGGGMTQPGGGFGSDYDDPQVDADYQGRKARYLTAYQKWVDAGRPQAWVIDADTGETAPNPDNPVAFEYASSLMDVQEFTSTFGNPKDRKDSDPAQTAFDNSIKLGDLDLRRGDSAYQQWYSKLTEARANADAEINDAINKNKMNESLASSFKESYGFGPAPSTETAIPGNYEKTLAKYKAKMGVGDTPPAATASGLAVPGAGGALPLPGASNAVKKYANSGPAVADTGEQFGPMVPQDGQPGLSGSGPGRSWDIIGAQSETPAPRYDVPNVNPGIVPSPGAMPNSDPKSPNILPPSVTGPVNAVKSTGKKVKKWWQKVPGFEDGVQGFEGGPAMVGERGPEDIEIPGFGTFRKGENGPEMLNLPAGTNVIPIGQKYLLSQIQGAVKQGRAPDQMRQQQEAMARRNDPQLAQKVEQALRDGVAGEWATKPPMTPVLVGEGWTEDPWADRRALTGIPASQQEYMAMMQKQGASRG